jgi:hypothetical protein
MIKEFTLGQMGRTSSAGLTAHLGHHADYAPPVSQKNRRNGVRALTLQGQDGKPPVSLILSFRAGEARRSREPTQRK